MPKTRGEFCPEFKRETVALLESSGGPLMQVATEVGTSPSMLWNRPRFRRCAASLERRWRFADLTYTATGEGWPYLATVLDLAIRKIIGWPMRNHGRNRAAAGCLDDRPRSGNDRPKALSAIPTAAANTLRRRTASNSLR